MEEKAQAIVDDGDRVTRMIRWLEENKARIMHIEKGRVAFDFAGPHLSARVEELQEKI